MAAESRYLSPDTKFVRSPHFGGFVDCESRQRHTVRRDSGGNYFEMPKAGCVVAMKGLGRICIHGRVDRAQGMCDIQERSIGASCLSQRDDGADCGSAAATKMNSAAGPKRRINRVP
jgi:hypothetical protein